MKPSIIEQLKAHLSSISQDEFLKEWSEIEALGLEGPTVEEYFSEGKMSFFSDFGLYSNCGSQYYKSSEDMNDIALAA